MASFSTTELNATVTEKWDDDVEEGRYSEAVFMPRIANKSAIADKGDILHLTYKGVYTVGAVGSNGAFVPQVYTPTSTAVTLNQFNQVAISVEDQAKFQSIWEPSSSFPKDSGKAFGALYDNALGSLHASFTSNVVGNASQPTPFTDVEMLEAMLDLANRNIPKNELSFILPPIAYYKGICSKPTFVDASAIGLDKSILTTNYRFPLMGIPAYESTQLTTSGTAIKGFLVHRTALAIAFTRKNIFKQADRTASLILANVAVAASIWGYNVWREDHGCVINIANS